MDQLIRALAVGRTVRIVAVKLVWNLCKISRFFSILEFWGFLPGLYVCVVILSVYLLLCLKTHLRGGICLFEHFDFSSFIFIFIF